MKRKLSPDNRLDWRDPNMPVLRFELRGRTTIAHFVNSKAAHEYYKFKMSDWRNQAPEWRNDPSYNWGRKKK